MIIGLDFDNTIVAYDDVFHRLATEQELIPANLPVNKTAVRDHLRATGQEPAWTAMQGTVYGARIGDAQLFPGVREFLLACRRRGIAVRIISHKTQFPYAGPRHDLHAAARQWLHAQGLINPATTGLQDDHVFFEPTKTEKLARIAACGCTHFIDDLPELLSAPEFPIQVARFLFDPEHTHPIAEGWLRVASWGQFRSLVFDDTTAAATTGLAARCGLRVASNALEPLQGGANNRVYRLALEDGRPALLKQYFQHPSDPRDRFHAERSFYQYLAAAKLTQTPAALGWSETDRVGVFSFIAGSRPPAVQLKHVNAALKFLQDLNAQRDRPEATALPAASEACFALDAHLASIRQRVARVQQLPAGDDLDGNAAEFVRLELLPAWAAVNEQFQNRFTSTARALALRTEDHCISPSDFGFHNVLVEADGTCRFFDFEYAGWDDPAKLVADFFCQPDVPASLQYFEGFVSAVATGLGLTAPDAFIERCHALLPAYQVKWACILLNDFSPVGRERRIFSLGASAAAERRERQLTRARAIISHLLLPV